MDKRIGIVKTKPDAKMYGRIQLRKRAIVNTLLYIYQNTLDDAP
jgi:hypothetical protein